MRPYNLSFLTPESTGTCGYLAPELTTFGYNTSGNQCFSLAFRIRHATSLLMTDHCRHFLASIEVSKFFEVFVQCTELHFIVDGRQANRADGCVQVWRFPYGGRCGKKPIYLEDASDVVTVVDHVWEIWGNSQILSIADPNLAGMCNANEMTKVLCVGLPCSRPRPPQRPSMHQVLVMLNGDISLPHVPPSTPIAGADIQRISQDHRSYWSTTSVESFS